MCNLTNQMLIVFLYKLLKDLKPVEISNNIVGQLLYKLIAKRNLSSHELLKEFIPHLELFLGNSLNFKKRLIQAVKIVQREDFNIEEFLEQFMPEFNTLKV